MKNLGKQTGLPSDVTKPLGPASSAYGFTNQHLKNRTQNPGEQPSGSVLTRMATFTYFVSTTAQTLLGESNQRNYLLIQNNGTGIVYVSFGGTPTVAGENAIQLPGGTGISFDSEIVPNNTVSVVSASSNLISVIEGTRLN